MRGPTAASAASGTPLPTRPPTQPAAAFLAPGTCRLPTGFSVSCLAASADGSRLAAAAGSAVTLYTLPGAGQGAGAAPAARPLPPLSGPVESLRFDCHGSLLASFYGGIVYWDLRRPEEEGQELELAYPANCLAADVSADCSWFVAGTHDATVHIFHLLPAGRGGGGMKVDELACGGGWAPGPGWWGLGGVLPPLTHHVCTRLASSCHAGGPGL